VEGVDQVGEAAVAASLGQPGGQTSLGGRGVGNEAFSDKPLVNLAQRAAHLPATSHDVPGAVDHVRPMDASHTRTCTHRTLFQVNELGKPRRRTMGKPETSRASPRPRLDSPFGDSFRAAAGQSGPANRRL
jgi:hypothetical protein